MEDSRINYHKIYDIVEENGLTIKENNLNKMHKYQINDLVALTTGAIVFVAMQTRDCDGTPLYAFKLDKDEGNTFYYIGGYAESSIVGKVTETDYCE